jgi:type II secretion system protein L
VDKNIVAGVIQKAKLRYWLDELAVKNIEVVRILPDIYALPHREGEMTLGLFDTHALVRSSFYHGYSLDLNTLLYLIEENEIDLENFRVINFARNLPVPIKQKLSSSIIKQQSELLAFAVGQNYPPSMNLLQGDFRVTFSLKKSLGPFLSLLILSGVTLLVFFASKLGLYFYYAYQNKMIEQKLAVIYAKIFPGQVFNASADSQLLKTLLRVEEENKDPFLSILARFAPVYQPLQNNLPLENLRFEKNILTVTLSGNANQADSLRKTLENQNLKVSQKNNPDQTLVISITP